MKKILISVSMLLISVTLLFALPDPGQCLSQSNPIYGSLSIVTGECWFQYTETQFVGYTTECQQAIGWNCSESVCFDHSQYCTWIPLD